MDINEFTQKYSNEISKFERATGKNAIWHNEITNLFIEHLQEKNIKINYKLPKTLIPKRYHYLPHISEFWLNFLQDNTFFTKKRVTEDYISEYTLPEDKCNDIKREFNNIIRRLLKYGIMLHYTVSTYKINKNMVSKYRAKGKETA